MNKDIFFLLNKTTSESLHCNRQCHNRQTEFSRISSNIWNKDPIRTWLDEHYITYSAHLLKTELLELCRANAPLKQYLVDNATATDVDVKVLRL